MRKKTFLILLVISAAATLASAQPTTDKAQLEKERKELQKELQEIQAIYDKVKGQTKQSLGQLNVLKRKIDVQEKYLSNINREIRSIDDDIYLSNLEIYRLQKQVDTLKTQYAKTVVYAYKNRSNYDFLNFIFSANTFNDAIKRVTYLKSYRAFREQQVNTIKETQALIARRKDEQLSKKRQKDDALKNQTQQAQVLEVQKKEKDVVLTQLKSQQKDLEKQLAAKKKKDRELKNAITALINREIDRRKKEAAAEAAANKPATTTTPGATGTVVTTKPASSKNVTVFNTDADLKLNASFETNRAKLPWPVDEGYVCIHFGPYKVGESKIKGDNPGITICTPQPGVNVKSVFSGEVFGIFNIGDSKSV